MMMTVTHYNHHDRDEDNDYFALNVYWPGEGRCRRGEWGRKSIVLSDYHRNCCHHHCCHPQCCHHHWWAMLQNYFPTALKVSSKKTSDNPIFDLGCPIFTQQWPTGGILGWRLKSWEQLNPTLSIFYMPEIWKFITLLQHKEELDWLMWILNQEIKPQTPKKFWKTTQQASLSDPGHKSTVLFYQCEILTCKVEIAPCYFFCV